MGLVDAVLYGERTFGVALRIRSVGQGSSMLRYVFFCDYFETVSEGLVTCIYYHFFNVGGLTGT